MRSPLPPPGDGTEAEGGAALLTVLLLIAVIATIATVLLDRVRLGARLAGAVTAQGDARGVALAAEAIALQRLRDPAARDTPALRAVLGRPMPVPLPPGIGRGGAIRAIATLADAGNCLNVNGLTRPDGSPEPLAGAAAARLARLVGVAPPVADALVRGLTAPPAAVAPPRPWADLGPLAALPGVPEEEAARLRPHLCALPDGRALPLNIDTLLPAAAPLLAAQVADAPLAPEAVRTALAQAPAGGYGSLVAFWAHPALGGARPLPPLSAQGGATTRWVEMTTIVEAGGQGLRASALIDLAPAEPVVVRRRWTPA